jgi:hypothetical protein
MFKTTEPELVRETVLSTTRTIKGRERKNYHRYLRKHKKEHGNPPSSKPLTYGEFCTWLLYYDDSP